MSHSIRLIAGLAAVAAAVAAPPATASSYAYAAVIRPSGPNPTCSIAQGLPAVGPDRARHAGTVACSESMPQIQMRVRLHHSPASDCSQPSDAVVMGSWDYVSIVSVNTVDAAVTGYGCWRGVIEVVFTFPHRVDAAQLASGGPGCSQESSHVLRCEYHTDGVPELP